MRLSDACDDTVMREKKAIGQSNACETGVRLSSERAKLGALGGDLKGLAVVFVADLFGVFACLAAAHQETVERMDIGLGRGDNSVGVS